MDTYHVDYDWAWGTKRPGDLVTLRAHLEFPDPATAKRAVAEFFDNLMAVHGFHGAGGWAAEEVTPAPGPTQRVIDFTAGGQDVADAIGYAAEDAVEHFSTFPGATVRWEHMPY